MVPHDVITKMNVEIGQVVGIIAGSATAPAVAASRCVSVHGIAARDRGAQWGGALLIAAMVIGTCVAVVFVSLPPLSEAALVTSALCCKHISLHLLQPPPTTRPHPLRVCRGLVNLNPSATPFYCACTCAHEAMNTSQGILSSIVPRTGKGRFAFFLRRLKISSAFFGLSKRDGNSGHVSFSLDSSVAMPEISMYLHLLSSGLLGIAD
jgi:hypothetical protein